MTARAANEARGRGGRGSQPIKGLGDGVICGSSRADCSKRTYLFDELGGRCEAGKSRLAEQPQRNHRADRDVSTLRLSLDNAGEDALLCRSMTTTAAASKSRLAMISRNRLIARDIA